MRMRKKKNGVQRLEDCDGLWIKQPESKKGNWQAEFSQNAPLHIEIGCGKGGFITQLAAANPDINYIAIEKLIDVLILAAEKVVQANLTNVRFILGDAAMLNEMFDDGECDRIYINFCDPWHKNRHSKRRLTYKEFLEYYRRVLKKDGAIYFKTDNKPLFEFSLNSFCENDYNLKNITLDLHNSDYKENIMTEYEKYFSEMGNPIYRLEATPR